MSHLCQRSDPAARSTLPRVKGLVSVPRILSAGLVAIVCGVLPAAADVPISTTSTDTRQIVLDHDPGTGNYFAVVRRWTGFLLWDWDLYLSTNQGAIWTEEGGAGSNAAIVIDMVVAGDYAFVGYTFASTGNVFIDSHLASDGSYASHQTLFDVSPARVVEIALASNRDSGGTEIYYAVILDDGSLRFFIGTSPDGTLVSELPLGISDACCGLDITFNPNSTDHEVFISYLSTDSTVHVWRTFPWEEVATFPYFGFDTRTAISASDDNVVLVWQTNTIYGASIIAYTSDDAGDTWDVVALDAPQFSGDGSFSMVDVTARGGQGFAAVYHQGLVGFDPVFIRRGLDFNPASWEPRVSINQFDVSTSRPVNINWFPPHHYGIAYVGDDGLPYFDLVDASLFSDGFESGSTSAWSATAP